MTDRSTSVPTRRALLLAGAATAATGAAGAAAATADTARRRPGPRVPRIVAPGGPDRHPDIAALEARHDRRIGVVARHLGTGRLVQHRPDERFVMCSTFKTLAVGAVLDGRLTSPDPHILERPAYWPPALVEGSGYAVRMEEWQRTGHVPDVAEVCEAAVAESDNAAANLLLGLVGGPGAVTELARSLGDDVTALTRWEPALNEWEPGATRDTTTPRAVAQSHGALLLGQTLGRRDRDLLRTWLERSVTGTKALRAGLPPRWSIAEKTGSGAYGTRNDVGVAWTPQGDPVVIACLTSASEPDAPTLDAALEDVGRVVGRILG